jgi:hypothetical protein
MVIVVPIQILRNIISIYHHSDFYLIEFFKEFFSNSKILFIFVGMKKNETQQKEGQFKTKSKFVEFVGGKGFVNFLSNEAFIMGNQLSGLEMDGLKFKLTIYDNMTVDFEEVDTNQTTKEQRARLIEIIEEKTITSYRNRTVVQELDFTSTTKVKDKYVSLYLAVETPKPIDKLASMFDESIQMSIGALDNLNNLLESWIDDEDDPTNISYEDVNQGSDDSYIQHHYTTGIDVTSKIQESFQTLKDTKLMELKSSKDKKEQELHKLEYQLTTIENSINQAKDDIKLIEDRIDDLQPKETPTGYYFNVSERQNEIVVLEPEIEKIIKDKVSKVKGINSEAFMKLFTDGEFHIKLGQMVDGKLVILESIKELSDEVFSRLVKLNLEVDTDKFIYRGELSWSQVVNKMIKLGFEESSEFNELCDIKTKETISHLPI